MEPTDGVPELVPAIRRDLKRRQGLAMFAVLILVVIFTLLGVGAITLANRETLNTGSILDIKSRQSASYAGLQFALGEFQRDPANFVVLLEAWRKKTVYGGLTNPLPRLYLKFDAAGANVVLTKTKPAPFALAGTPYKVVVEWAGIQIPSSGSADPVLVLRSTGAGRSGDEQTVVGAYAIRNVRYNLVSASLGITHPYYVNGKGIWNNRIAATGGDVFFGNTTHLNSATAKLTITNGGLRVNGDFGWDVMDGIDVQGNSWVTGAMAVKSLSSGVFFRRNLVVGKDINYAMTAQIDILGSLVIQGASVLGNAINLHSGTINVGAGIAGSEFQAPNGAALDSSGNGTISVVGSAYLKQISNAGKSWKLNVSDRLELADDASVMQKFIGSGVWGSLVARTAKSGSFIRPGLNKSITIQKNSWLEEPSAITFGSAFLTFQQLGTLYYKGSMLGCPGCVGITGTPGAPPVADKISTIAYAGAGVASGYDKIYPPQTLSALGYGAVTPATEKEVGFDISKDPSILANAWLATGSALCDDASKYCGASLNKAATDPANAGNYHNGFFVVRLASSGFTWDKAGGAPKKTDPLQGKFLFIVTVLITGTECWPTTATNPDPANPTNVQFIYVTSTGNIFAGFSPRTTEANTTTTVPFFGYVRVEDPGAFGRSWDLKAPMDLQGAVHILGDRTKVSMTVNSSTGISTFNLNQGVLNLIGAAFGSVFLDPITGNPLANPALGGFVATENWIQFRTLSELR